MFQRRMDELRERMAENGFDVVLITDEDSVYYYAGYYDYLHMEFGRPTILALTRHDGSLLITPSMELEMARASAAVDRIAPWNDGSGEEWRAELPGLVHGARKVGIELDRMPPPVRACLDPLLPPSRIQDISPVIAAMRMIKSAEELALARHAGEVAEAMMNAGRDALGDGIPEYEVALATSAAGAHKAAALLQAHYADSRMSPNVHFLQIMASGDEIVMPHRRASTRIMKRGEPVFLCFCGMTDFHRFKLGFDRTFWIGGIEDDDQRAVYETALASQQAALEVLGPGTTAEEVHGAYAEVIQSAGYSYPFRCGRATGFSYLESPQLVYGDRTVLRPGMVLAVDGSVGTPTFRAQVGDSFIVTEHGFEQITRHPKALDRVVVK